jgi:Sulfotransferase family
MNSAEQEPVRMIAGMSRAGTTWLCKSLNAHPDVAAFGESRFFARCFVQARRQESYSPPELRDVVCGLQRRILSTTIGDGPGSLPMRHSNQVSILAEEFANETRALSPGDVYVRMCRAIAHGNGRRIAVEKTPQHILWLGRVLKYISRIRMVVMLRDPYSFMLSYKHQGDRKPSGPREEFRHLYHPVACALIWRRYMRAAWEEFERHPDQILLVRNEELVEPEQLLERIQRFFEIEPLISLRGASIGVNSSFPEGTRPELESEDIYWINRLAKQEVLRYGCEVRPLPPNARLAAMKSLVALPMWSLHNYLTMRRRVSGSAFRYMVHWLSPSCRHSE